MNVELQGAADTGTILDSAMEKAAYAVAKVLTEANAKMSDVRANFPISVVSRSGWSVSVNMVDMDLVIPYIRQWIFRAGQTGESYTDSQAFYKACLQTPGTTATKANIIASAMNTAWQKGYLDTDTQDLIRQPSKYTGDNLDKLKAWMAEQIKKAGDVGSNYLDIAKITPYLLPLVAIGVGIWFLAPYRNIGNRVAR